MQALGRYTDAKVAYELAAWLDPQRRIRRQQSLLSRVCRRSDRRRDRQLHAALRTRSVAGRGPEQPGARVCGSGPHGLARTQFLDAGDPRQRPLQHGHRLSRVAATIASALAAFDAASRQPADVQSSRANVRDQIRARLRTSPRRPIERLDWRIWTVAHDYHLVSLSRPVPGRSTNLEESGTRARPDPAARAEVAAFLGRAVGNRASPAARPGVPGRCSRRSICSRRSSRLRNRRRRVRRRRVVPLPDHRCRPHPRGALPREQPLRRRGAGAARAVPGSTCTRYRAAAPRRRDRASACGRRFRIW